MIATTIRRARKIHCRLDRRLYENRWRDVSRLRLPDFLGIGAQKAGTTWLYENLRNHQEIFLPETKELHYFDWHMDKMTVHDYGSHFSPAGGRLAGEITPGYSILDESQIRLVRQLMPEVKLILLLRDPVERAWSHAFKNIVEIPGRQIDGVDDWEYINHILSERSVRRGDYISIIARWRRVFPPDRLFIGLYDELCRNPTELLASIFDFLGVACDDGGSTGAHDVIRPHYNEMGTVGWGKRTNKQALSGKRMPPRIREFLQEFYDRDIRLLQTILGGPVLNWGKPVVKSESTAKQP